MKAVKVIHEKETKELRQAREVLSKAEIICCLGFGYHPENVARLELDKIFTTTSTQKVALPGPPGSKRPVTQTFPRQTYKTVFLSTCGFTEKETDRLLTRLYPKGRPGRSGRQRRQPWDTLYYGRKNQDVLTFLRENAVFD